MADEVYVCPNCGATTHHKGKCDMCQTKLIRLDIWLQRKEIKDDN